MLFGDPNYPHDTPILPIISHPVNSNCYKHINNLINDIDYNNAFC